MSRDVRLFLEDIVESCDKILRYTDGSTFEEFRADERTFDAVARNLEIIDEAVKQVPSDIRDRHPDVEWRKLAGLRDVVIKQYFGIDEELIWDVVTTRIGPLRTRMKAILAALPSDE